MSHIAIVVASLDGGGTERTALVLADVFTKRGHDVTIVTAIDYGPDFLAVPPSVARVRVDVPFSPGNRTARLLNIGRRVHALRRILQRRPLDAVIALGCDTNVMTLIAALGLRVRVVVSERTDPRRQPVSWLLAAARRLTYRWAAALVVQTDALRPWAEQYASRRRVFVIPNGARVPQPRGSAMLARPSVVAIASLNAVKGVDLLIQAFARTREAFPGWTLHVFGEGPERSRLEALARDLGVAESVRLPGRTEDPYAVLSAADLYVLPSRFEGFPNALLEAMASGCACVATDCECGAPRSIIRHGVDGVLVRSEDVDALAAAMSRLMGDEGLRRALSSRAPECLQRFSLEIVGSAWLEAAALPDGLGHAEEDHDARPVQLG
jgi:GalNAc-alpha-(1->4)-GalNAc-alpha-(1->3)-diNAcBac-PP-undecaprenol alpha-1,4-N-acetyl-D-galactosaminyltransferase